MPAAPQTLELTPHADIRGTATLAATTFTANGNLQLVATLKIRSPVNRKLGVTLTNAGAALTGLKVATAATPGGTLVDQLTDTDFNTATAFCPRATTNLYQLTNASGQFVLDVAGVADVAIYAKAASGSPTLAIQASL